MYPTDESIDFNVILLSYRQAQTNLVLFGAAQVYIEYLEVPYSSGKGHGSRALRTICKWADRESIDLVLVAAPFGGRNISKAELIAWYKRYGFKRSRSLKRSLIGQRLLRKPNVTS